MKTMHSTFHPFTYLPLTGWRLWGHAMGSTGANTVATSLAVNCFGDTIQVHQLAEECSKFQSEFPTATWRENREQLGVISAQQDTIVISPIQCRHLVRMLSSSRLSLSIPQCHRTQVRRRWGQLPGWADLRDQMPSRFHPSLSQARLHEAQLCSKPQRASFTDLVAQTRRKKLPWFITM